MGLPDYYVDNIIGQIFGEPPRSIPLPGHSNDLMGTGNQVTQDDIDGILQGKKCPKECCCPPSSKPAGTR